MSRKNDLLDALSGNDDVIGVNRKELREALSELSTSSRRSSINHSLNRKYLIRFLVFFLDCYFWGVFSQ